MDELLSSLASGDPVNVQVKVDSESAAMLAGGIFLAIVLGFALGGLLNK